MKLSIAVLSYAILSASSLAHAQQDNRPYTQSKTDRFSQKALLKNWALSVCLAKITKDPATKEDASISASAYLEYGRQPIEAYDTLATLAQQYADRRYGSSIKGEFNVMKCIDLFHSKELDTLTSSLLKTK